MVFVFSFVGGPQIIVIFLYCLVFICIFFLCLFLYLKWSPMMVHWFFFFLLSTHLVSRSILSEMFGTSLLIENECKAE
jgi:hypothetical protein